MSNQLEEEPTPYGKAGTFAPAGSGVTERAKDVASEAGQQTRQVATEAHEQAREVVSEVRNRTRDLVGQTQAELRDQAELRTQRAAEGLRTLGQQLEALRQGRPEEAGLVGGYVDQAQRNVVDIADRLDRDGFEAVISD